MSERLPRPAVFLVADCVIDLQDVSAVICSIEPGGLAPVCRVILKSGVSFSVDMQYSRSLIQAVEWNRSPGSVVRPKDGLLDQGELVGKSCNDHSAAIARDIRLGCTSRVIIGKVGMMANARTPEMQARYDAAVAREQGLPLPRRHLAKE
jgi:hypothetical protein